MMQKIIRFVLRYKYYFLIGGGLFYMTFFDVNSFIKQYKLSQELSELKQHEDYYRSEIKKDSLIIQALSQDEGMEKYAREHYYMKKENEDIFIVVREEE